MKRLGTTTCMILLTLFAVTGYAQSKKVVKPFLFTNLPATIHCTVSQLSSMFAAAKGQNISLALANNFTLSGPVTSNQQKYGNLHTIVIKLAAYNNSLFSLSKQTDHENNITYVGRILNPLYADGYELKQDATGDYQLVKSDLEKIVVICNQ